MLTTLQSETAFRLALFALAALGAYDILTDLGYGHLTVRQLLFNLPFLLPLFFRNWKMLMAYSILTAAFGIYIMAAALIFYVKYSGVMAAVSVTQIFVVTPVFSCGLLLIATIFFLVARRKRVSNH